MFITRILLSIIIGILTVASAIANSDTSELLKERLGRLHAAPDDKSAILDVANSYLLLGDYDNAEIYADKLLKIAEETGDRDFSGLNGAKIKSIVMMSRGNAEEAFRMLEYSRVIAQNAGDHKTLAYIHNGFVLYYSTIANDYYSAINHSLQGLEEARLAGDDYRVTFLLLNLAEIYNDMRDREGLNYILQAYELAKKIDDKIALFYTTLDLAEAYMIRGEMDEADRVLKETEKYAVSLGYDRSVEFMLVKAQNAHRSGDLEKATALFEQLFNCDFYDPSRSIIMRSYLTYARFLNETGNPEKAIEIAEEGLAYAKGFNLSYNVGDLLRELAIANRQLGHYSKALNYSTQYSDFLDSTFHMTRERAMIENRIKYEIDEQDRRLRENERELRMSHLRTAILSVLLIILICFVIVALEYYRRKKRLYRAIVTQNSEFIEREKILLEQVEKAKSNGATEQKCTLSEDKADDLMSRFTLLMTEKKLFKESALTVNAVADRLGTNRTYLSRAINETGKTFNQIINDYRIREAIGMISDLDAALPLKQISSDVGFNSITTFYSTFQSVTGMTPARYRNQMKEIHDHI